MTELSKIFYLEQVGRGKTLNDSHQYECSIGKIIFLSDKHAMLVLQCDAV